MTRGLVNRIGMCYLFFLFFSGTLFLSLTDSSCLGQAIPVLHDDFNFFNTNLWDVHEFGSHDFNFTCDSWLWNASWLHVPVFESGGSDPAYNGFHFVHTLHEPLEGEFTVETELGWSALSMSPMFQIELRLLDASDYFLADGSWSLSLQCRDYWVASSCRPVASNEDVQVEGEFLPLEGSETIRITRSSDFHVEIYWAGNLMLSGINSDIITQICLRLVGRHDFPGAGGGFDYIYAYASSTDIGNHFTIPLWMDTFVVLGMCIIIIQLTILIYLIVKKKRI